MVLNGMTIITSPTIKAMRERLGLTQAGLGARLRVSKRTVWRWEHGASAPHPVYLDRIREMVEAAHREAITEDGTYIEQT